jgi:ELWxxDGT repeat protein
VRSTTSRADFTISGGKLFFIGNDAAHGNELWESDGTLAVTSLVKDLTAGSDGTILEKFTDIAGTLFFFRDYVGPSLDVELWKSDGSDSGTTLVSNLGQVRIDSAIALGRQLFFVALDANGFPRLWRSDGTEAGTRIIREGDLVAASRHIDGPSLGVIDGILLFAGELTTDPYDFELWRSDGTDEGTFLVQEIAPGGDPSDPNSFVRAGNRVFFGADDTTHGAELWGGRASIVTVQPRLALQELREELHALALPSAKEAALVAKLDAATQALDRGARRAAIGSLGAFSNAVAAHSGKSIAAPDVEELLAFAGEITGLLRSGRSAMPSAAPALSHRSPGVSVQVQTR